MKFSILILGFCLLSIVGLSQELAVNIIDNFSNPVQKRQLNEAKSMKDINADYPSSWIADSDYISTEIIATCNGVEMRATGQNERLNPSQQRVLRSADIATTIQIEVKYKVKNSITERLDVKTMKFAISYVPETKATFVGGEDALNLFLKENTLDQINKTDHSKFEMAKVKFFINPDGKIGDSKVLTSSGDNKVDQILLDAISKMPNWTPAKDFNGKALRQELQLHVGMLIGC